MKAMPTSTSRRRPGILLARWLGMVLLGMATSHCGPHPPGFVPRIPSECGNWDSRASRNEIRGFANDLANLLPDWYRTRKDPSVKPDYGGLKAAAIKMARAPQCVQWAVIESYYRAYCDQREYDAPMCMRMLPLMRVLFVVPTGHPEGTDFLNAWPVHPDPSGDVLEIDWYRGMPISVSMGFYNPRGEYAHFAVDKRFRMRTLAQIQALEIRARP
jgi:hypothetical protein